jgi:hypothetical protein
VNITHQEKFEDGAEPTVEGPIYTALSIGPCLLVFFFFKKKILKFDYGFVCNKEFFFGLRIKINKFRLMKSSTHAPGDESIRFFKKHMIFLVNILLINASKQMFN